MNTKWNSVFSVNNAAIRASVIYKGPAESVVVTIPLKELGIELSIL